MGRTHRVKVIKDGDRFLVDAFPRALREKDSIRWETELDGTFVLLFPADKVFGKRLAEQFKRDAPVEFQVQRDCPVRERGYEYCVYSEDEGKFAEAASHPRVIIE